jgi:hypothetical protein
MQPWISLANVIGDLLVLAAAAIDLAAARARRDRPRHRQGNPAKKAITARYHAHHDTYGGSRRQGRAHLQRHYR